jgi:hypothetical protein
MLVTCFLMAVLLAMVTCEFLAVNLTLKQPAWMKDGGTLNGGSLQSSLVDVCEEHSTSLEGVLLINDQMQYISLNAFKSLKAKASLHTQFLSRMSPRTSTQLPPQQNLRLQWRDKLARS